MTEAAAHMAIEFRLKGNFSKTRKHLSRLTRLSLEHKLKPYAEKGVYELAKNTPIDTGATARSWDYRIVSDKDGITIKFINNNAPYGVPVAIMIQNGHATRGGTYVQGIDYINPALRPVFEDIASMIQREVEHN